MADRPLQPDPPGETPIEDTPSSEPSSAASPAVPPPSDHPSPETTTLGEIPSDGAPSEAVPPVRKHHLVPLPFVKPWVPDAQLQALTDAIALRRRRRQLAWRSAFTLAGLSILFYFSPSLIQTSPRQKDLDQEAEHVGQLAHAHFSSSIVPLQLISSQVALESEISRDRHLYEVTVRLRLLHPLYVHATGKIADEYRQLQQALFEARSEAQKSTSPDQFEAMGFPAELPELVGCTHFAGKEIRVSAILTAERDRFTWKLTRPLPDSLEASRTLSGEAMLNSHVLIFDEMDPDPAIQMYMDEVKIFFENKKPNEP